MMMHWVCSAVMMHWVCTGVMMHWVCLAVMMHWVSTAVMMHWVYYSDDMPCGMLWHVTQWFCRFIYHIEILVEGVCHNMQ